MITNSDIIPSTHIEEVEEGDDVNSFSHKLNVRFWSKPHGTIYALFLIGLLVFVVFKNTILLLAYELGKYAYNIMFDTAVNEDIFADSTQNDNIYREFPVEDLGELYFKAKKELSNY